MGKQFNRYYTEINVGINVAFLMLTKLVQDNQYTKIRPLLLDI